MRQEFYGLLMTHYAVRGLMHEAALKGGQDPDHLSFVHAVRVIRRKLPLFVALSPPGIAGGHMKSSWMRYFTSGLSPAASGACPEA